MPYFTYILYSPQHDKFYIGQTNNVQARLNRHNSGYVNFTKTFKPWELKLAIEKENRSQAMILERKLKMLSKNRILKFIEKYS